jgi:hypothetical protein
LQQKANLVQAGITFRKPRAYESDIGTNLQVVKFPGSEDGEKGGEGERARVRREERNLTVGRIPESGGLPAPVKKAELPSLAWARCR